MMAACLPRHEFHGRMQIRPQAKRTRVIWLPMLPQPSTRMALIILVVMDTFHNYNITIPLHKHGSYESAGGQPRDRRVLCFFAFAFLFATTEQKNSISNFCLVPLLVCGITG